MRDDPELTPLPPQAIKQLSQRRADIKSVVTLLVDHSLVVAIGLIITSGARFTLGTLRVLEIDRRSHPSLQRGEDDSESCSADDEACG